MEHALGLEPQLVFILPCLSPLLAAHCHATLHLRVCLTSPTHLHPHDSSHSLPLERAWAQYWEDQDWVHIPFLCHASMCGK